MVRHYDMVTGETIAEQLHERTAEAREMTAVLPEASLRLMTLQEAVAIERSGRRLPAPLAGRPAKLT